MAVRVGVNIILSKSLPGYLLSSELKKKIMSSRPSARVIVERSCSLTKIMTNYLLRDVWEELVGCRC